MPGTIPAARQHLIDDIAKRAGIQRRSVYRQFTDKDDLFTAALESAIAEVLQRARRGGRRPGPGLVLRGHGAGDVVRERGPHRGADHHRLAEGPPVRRPGAPVG